METPSQNLLIQLFTIHKSYYLNIRIQSIFVLKVNDEKRWCFPKLVLPETFMRKLILFLKQWYGSLLEEFFFENDWVQKWDFSLVHGKTLSLLSYLAFSVSVNAQRAYSTMFSLFALFYTGKTRLHTNFGSGLLLAHFWICTKTLCFLHFWKFRVFFIFAPFFLCFLQLLLKFLAFVNLEINCFFAPIFSSKNKCFLEKMVQKRN